MAVLEAVSVCFILMSSIVLIHFSSFMIRFSLGVLTIASHLLNLHFNLSAGTVSWQAWILEPFPPLLAVSPIQDAQRRLDSEITAFLRRHSVEKEGKMKQRQKKCRINVLWRCWRE
jgi:hypothetical protein